MILAPHNVSIVELTAHNALMQPAANNALFKFISLLIILEIDWNLMEYYINDLPSRYYMPSRIVFKWHYVCELYYTLHFL